VSIHVRSLVRKLPSSTAVGVMVVRSWHQADIAFVRMALSRAKPTSRTLAAMSALTQSGHGRTSSTTSSAALVTAGLAMRLCHKPVDFDNLKRQLQQLAPPRAEAEAWPSR
jgi:hypothetical protein